MADVYDGNDKIGDREIQEFLMIEKQRAQLTAQVRILSCVFHHLNIVEIDRLLQYT